MRDFNFNDANTPAANVAGVQPIPQELPLTLSDDLRRDEIIEDGAHAQFLPSFGRRR